MSEANVREYVVHVLSDLDANHKRGCVVQVGADYAFTVPPGRATLYGCVVIQAATVADYLGAVYRQMRREGLTDEIAIEVVNNVFKASWEPPDISEITPYVQFEPRLGGKRRLPIVQVTLRGEPVEDWTPGFARDHAVEVMGTVSWAILDDRYFRVLVEKHSVPEADADSFVRNLVRWMAVT